MTPDQIGALADGLDFSGELSRGHFDHASDVLERIKARYNGNVPPDLLGALSQISLNHQGAKLPKPETNARVKARRS